MSLEQLGLQIETGALIGFITGWGLKKLLRIVVKLVAIILAAFFGGLLWLQVQRIVTVNWKELEQQTRESIEWIANTTINDVSGTHTLNQVINTLGIPFAAPLGMAFVAGFVKGLSSTEVRLNGKTDVKPFASIMLCLSRCQLCVII